MKKLKCMLVISMTTSFALVPTFANEIHTPDSLNAVPGPALSGQQNSLVTEAVFSGELHNIENLTRRNPDLAPAIAALYVKRSRTKGRLAGEVIAMVANSANADLNQISNITAAACQSSTTASIKDVAQIGNEVGKALKIDSDLESFSAFLGGLANRLGLKGEFAGDFAAFIISDRGYTGSEAGTMAGAIAWATSGSSQRDAEELLDAVLAKLALKARESDEIVTTVENEIGQELIVIYEPKNEIYGYRVKEDPVINPLDELFLYELYHHMGQDIASSPF